MNILSAIKNINRYILNPKYNVETHFTIKQKWLVLFSSLLYCVIVTEIIHFFIIDTINDYIIPTEFTENFQKMSLGYIITMAIIAAPIIEEIVFRLPLKINFNTLKIKKIENFWIKNFKVIFYLFSFGFALVHITNYNNNQILFYLLAPLIVLSQGFLGLVMGYLRMHFGLKWAILNHALFNFTIFIQVLLLHHSLVIDINDNTIDLKIHHLEYYNKEKEIVSFDENTITSIDWNDETIQKLLDTLYNSKYKIKYNHLVKVKLKSKQPISKEAFLDILKQEYEIIKRDSL